MSPSIPQQIIGLSTSQKVFKRLLDVLLSLILIPTLLFPVSILIILATVDTKIFGLFFQNRVGQDGKGFTIYKIRTYNRNGEVSKFSKKIRNYKLDEIPQIFNILLGQMSFVGPRPDVLEVMSTLSKSDQVILSIKPGLTGPASLYYFNEEAILAKQEDPIAYNNQILTPKKNAINKDYIKNYHIFNDLKYIYKTTLYVFQNMAL
ncbi:MAG: sugar transferase [Flavobacteriaceae bacterium]|nr:sugar transferase [Flavobacteriaceae bacterium]|tara:strand:- start:27 stop:641 length:615 start_codon:yes stop_codon:yes gene_type:complete